MSNKYFYTYVLKSAKDEQLYIGYTQDIEKRIERHNAGEVMSTKNRRPLELIYFEGCKSRENAILREKQLKTGFGRAYLKRRLR